MSKILITGGAGYIGSVLTKTLVHMGHSALCYDNLTFDQTPFLDICHKKNFSFVYGDVRDTAKLQSFLNVADVIIPLAAVVGFPACEKQKELATQLNLNQIDYILQHTSTDQKIIYPNTNSGYGHAPGESCTEKSPLNPVSHYGRTKVAAEKLLLASGRAVTLRLATVFGASPRMRTDLLVNDFVYQAVTDGYLLLFERHFKRNYIHIKDVVSAFVFAMQNFENCRGEAFNVGLSTANLSKQELAETIKKYVPQLIINHNEYTKDPDQRDYIVSNEKIETLGWQAKYSLDDGIQELIKAYAMITNIRNNLKNV